MDFKKLLLEIADDWEEKTCDENGEVPEDFDLFEWINSWMCSIEILLSKKHMRRIRKADLTGRVK